MSILLLSLCLVVLLLCFTVYNRAYHPLHSFPGPFWAAQTDLWRVYHICTKQMPGTLEALHATHGPVVRIGPNDLSFQSAQAIGPIYKSGRRVIKSSFYDGFTAFHPNLFGAQDEDLHALRRRQMAHSFSQASLAKMEYIFDRHIVKLLSAIDRQRDSTFDLKTLIAYYTYDVVGELIFNADFGSQDAAVPELLPPINDHIWLGCVYGMLPALLPYSMRLAPWIPLPWLQDKLRSRKALRDKTAAHVKAELDRDKSEEGQNILNRLVNAQDPETGEGLTEVEISSEAFAFLVAGSHTTSGSLTLLFYHLLHNPEVGEKLSKELSESVSLLQGEVGGNIPTFSGLEQKLPYMTACIRESFRVSPVFTMPLPRKVVEREGLKVGDLIVPEGTNISICNQVVHHDSNTWGSDAMSFRPERWLDSAEMEADPNNLMPFGAGHRACIGRNIAMMSIVKVLAVVWSKYTLEADDRDEQLVVESVGIGEKKGPLMVRMKA